MEELRRGSPGNQHEWDLVGIGDKGDGRIHEIAFCSLRSCQRYRIGESPAMSRRKLEEQFKTIEWL